MQVTINIPDTIADELHSEAVDFETQAADPAQHDVDRAGARDYAEALRRMEASVRAGSWTVTPGDERHIRSFWVDRPQLAVDLIVRAA